MGDSAENRPAIFIRGGERWLMSYCWPTPQRQNLCVQHAFFEGKKAEETSPRKSTPRTLKEVGQQYLSLVCDSSLLSQSYPFRLHCGGLGIRERRTENLVKA